jgi:hypothetical protein
MGEIRTIPITKTELQDIEETMLNLCNSFPELPEQVKQSGILFEQLKPKTVSMCLSSISSPIKATVDLDGSYLAKYPFALTLATMDVSNQERIDSQAILSKIGEWFEGRTIVDKGGNPYCMWDFPKMQDCRTIKAMYRTSQAKIVGRLAPNIELTQARYEVKYYVKNDF